jgi:beta-glucanase (GH16 family)
MNIKNRIKIFLLTVITFFVFVENSNAQVSPKDDPNWILDVAKSDEFNGSVLDANKWDMGDWEWGSAFVSPSNVIMDNGYLRLRWKRPDTNPDTTKKYLKMSVGQIKSKNSNYGYGYFEISAKILDPGNYDSTGVPCARGLWPCFWLYNASRNPCYHDEIDIVEKLYHNCSEVNMINEGVVDFIIENDTCKDHRAYPTTTTSYEHSEALFEAEHKYAAEWLSDKIIFYLDDKPFGIYKGAGIPQSSQRNLYVVLSMQYSNSGFDKTPNSPDIEDFNNLADPQYMKVDYFRYYKLNKTYCGTDATILNNTQLNNFIFGVRRKITIGNSSSNITLPANSTTVFRFTDEIIIEGDFTVPADSELYLIPTNCD